MADEETPETPEETEAEAPEPEAAEPDAPEAAEPEATEPEAPKAEATEEADESGDPHRSEVRADQRELEGQEQDARLGRPGMTCGY